MEKIETVRGRKSTWAYAFDDSGRLAEAKLDGRLICQCWYGREGRRVRDYLPATAGANYRDYQYTPDNRLMRAGGGQYSHDERGFRSIWSDKGVYTLYEYARTTGCSRPKRRTGTRPSPLPTTRTGGGLPNT
ncbi:hypothetical protein [Pseudodesulfovibrio hydrargyri]|uniref:hypothetical protein n=1 Tax=Pseudodesulfovibrio hydrargyri TaxID=2125990 RepID=UPI001F605498|nr:hypothetical protein [Pseudodesulfovibrio hydrargyri]